MVDGLNRKVRGRTISKIWLDYRRAVKFPLNRHGFERALAGAKILDVARLGKYIIFGLDKDRALFVHPKMTGHFLFGRWHFKKEKGRFEPASTLSGPLHEKVNTHIHFLMNFKDGDMLAFCDARKFGTLRAGDRNEILNLKEFKTIGPDLLDKKLIADEFIRRAGAKRKNIKQVLLDQSVVAGAGNIYSDEALYIAKIHPLRRASSLTGKELADLFAALRGVLQKSIKLRGTTSSDFRDVDGTSGGYWNHRLVYRREGEKCGRDGSIIKRAVIGARSAHYCPKCQKIK